MVYLLQALHPRMADLQRLMYLDYAVIYSADVGGPESLHTPVPLRGVEYASRRQVIEDGLYLMVLRSFVDVVPSATGILYGLGENGSSLVELLGGDYTRALAEKCMWVAAKLGDKTDADLEEMFGANGILWRAHFVGAENAWGAE